ncbi:MAG: NAD(P)H-dependent oxidoreductase subunit E [Firmicutes bacterium]|nr:NAD(P)H-dependent oxidoreductase subunit E [Bacillota bacterium]
MSEQNLTKFEKVCEILDRYDRDAGNLIAILGGVQEEYSYLPEDVITFVATALGVTPGHVYGVATFYAHFTLEPKGKYVIKVCDGTACHVRKSGDVIKTFESELGLTESRKTSEDMLFTLEVVACIGACGLAPVITINEDVYAAMTIDKTKELVAEYRKREAGE